MGDSTEIKAIKQEIQKHRSHGGRVVFSKDLKKRVLGLWQKGCDLNSLSHELQMHKSQIYKWRQDLSIGSTKHVDLQKDELSFHEIPIVAKPICAIKFSPSSPKAKKFKFRIKIFSLRILIG